MTEPTTSQAFFRTPLAGLLSWILPGLGHWIIGDRTRGVILMIAITLTFWTGIAIGGVRETIDTHNRKLWFAAQICAGGNALAAYAWNNSYQAEHGSGITVENPAHWASVDVGVHYTGVAGLLNILVIFDAVGRAERVNRRRPRSKGGGP